MEELDCETTSSYTLTVTANNSLSVCPKSASVTVSITVNDINDNSPVFTEDSYYIELFENITIPSPVLTIEARDGDKNVSCPVHLPHLQPCQTTPPPPHSHQTMTCCTH